jgi:hypothetical protein
VNSNLLVFSTFLARFRWNSAYDISIQCSSTNVIFDKKLFLKICTLLLCVNTYVFVFSTFVARFRLKGVLHGHFICPFQLRYLLNVHVNRKTEAANWKWAWRVAACVSLKLPYQSSFKWSCEQGRAASVEQEVRVECTLTTSKGRDFIHGFIDIYRSFPCLWKRPTIQQDS